jgi:hypothetical protein
MRKNFFMRMKKNIVTLFLAGISLVASTFVKADCLGTYTDATLTCSTTESNVDNTAYNVYWASYTNAQNTDSETVAQDALTQANIAEGCLTALYTFTGNPAVFNDVGSCGNAVVVQDQAAVNAYNSAVVACGTNNRCLCTAATTETFAEAAAGNLGAKCSSDAQNTYNNQCVPNSVASQNQSDGQALETYYGAVGTAQATYDQTVDVDDNDTTPLCNQTASTAYANCLLAEDCSTNKANCCADGCNETFNNQWQAGYAAFMNTTASAYGTYVYKTDMCGTTQSEQDQAAYTLNAYTLAEANITYNFSQTAAWNLYQYTTSMNTASNIMAGNNCACTATNDSQYNGCVAAANAVLVSNNNNALTAYNAVANVPPAAPTGTDWNTWNATTTNANNTLQTTLASDSLTEQTNSQNALNTYNAILNSAETTLNTAWDRANLSFASCMKGCGNG